MIAPPSQQGVQETSSRTSDMQMSDCLLAHFHSEAHTIAQAKRSHVYQTLPHLLRSFGNREFCGLPRGAGGTHVSVSARYIGLSAQTQYC